MIRFILFLILFGYPISAQEFRFPQPEFSGAYQIPETEALAASNPMIPWFDILYISVAITAGILLLYRYRSRLGLLILTLASLVYLGFVRKGCVCPVGSVQPILNALFDDGLKLSITVMAVFLIPVLTALFFGRIFCGSVCPLGAVQELTARVNIRIPRPVSSFLKIIPPAYLILSGVSAATGSAYLICRFDPFVSMFRLEPGSGFPVLTISILALSIIIYRPYCRFICPYGYILGWVSRLSLYKVWPVEEDCINCGICRTECPAEAIEGPGSGEYGIDKRRKNLRRLIAVLPVLVLLAALGGDQAGSLLSTLNRDVALIEAFEVPGEENGVMRKAFLAGDRSFEELETDAYVVDKMWRRGLSAGAAFMVVITMAWMMGKLRNNRKNRHETSPAICLSCGRCYVSCPKEIVKNKGLPHKGDES